MQQKHKKREVRYQLEGVTLCGEIYKYPNLPMYLWNNVTCKKCLKLKGVRY